MSAARGVVAPEALRRFGGGALAPFSQMLVVGLVVCALALPVVTALPALAAGVHHLDRHLSARRDGWGDLARLCWSAVRTGWWLGLAVTAVAALLALNVSAGALGLVPGGGAVAVVSAALGVALAVVAARTAALWTPGASWPALVREAAHLAWTDPVGSVFVLLGYGVSAVVVWMLPPLVVITPGMLAVALLAAERRRASR
ncbi:hypothetical protein [Cellulomonas triticagri]|uniref:Poxvirus protein I5 n=1 Tax=Cellulomonas triticagri TaxID=2483352 RepID=A0A3M2J4Y9_9CELL|nr:hypothetical protein [Cellulomonas triticagri]RMI06980.1 hypothetical protein EBM89_14270 [Cellulomonas triticagri]